ncbi:hypothetical protein K2Y11_22190 [bacterium]|nr:hypothetical protein [bacterium]
MNILAMTSVSGVIGLISFIACLGLMAHALFPWTFITREVITVKWFPLLIRFILECTATFLWLSVILPLLAWSLWIGDYDHWFFHYAWVIAAVVAISIFGFRDLRILQHGISASYLSYHLWGAIALLLTFGTVVGYESLHRIEGLTPETASQSVSRRFMRKINEDVNLVEDTRPRSGHQSPDRYRAYCIMAGNEPRFRFTIARHRWFGWTFASSIPLRPFAEELRHAKGIASRSSNSSDRKSAIWALEQMIANYPETVAKVEAEQLLKSLRDNGTVNN